jgi:hypothetical protein
MLKDTILTDLKELTRSIEEKERIIGVINVADIPDLDNVDDIPYEIYKVMEDGR